MKALFSYSESSRDAKKFIHQLLRIDGVVSVKKMNYVKSYTLEKGSVVSHQEKLFLVDFLHEKQQYISDFLKKHHPMKDGVDIIFLG